MVAFCRKTGQISEDAKLADAVITAVQLINAYDNAVALSWLYVEEWIRQQGRLRFRAITLSGKSVDVLDEIAAATVLLSTASVNPSRGEPSTGGIFAAMKQARLEFVLHAYLQVRTQRKRPKRSNAVERRRLFIRMLFVRQ